MPGLVRFDLSGPGSVALANERNQLPWPGSREGGGHIAGGCVGELVLVATIPA